MGKEESSQLIQPPVIWRMEPYISNLIELSSVKSPELAIRINLATIAFNKKCAIAEIELYDEIQKIMG
jgi:hypothetical protein